MPSTGSTRRRASTWIALASSVRRSCSRACSPRRSSVAGIIAEVWLYPDGQRILELSTKCLPNEAFEVAADARAYLQDHGVPLDGIQQTKTKSALDFFGAELRAEATDGSTNGGSAAGTKTATTPRRRTTTGATTRRTTTRKATTAKR